MPQGDLETLVSDCAGGGTDRKIACETLADTKEDPPENDDVQASAGNDVPPDFPPESFWLSKDAELDWLDSNAFYERKESTKGMSQSSNTHPSSNSNSQRFGLNLTSKTSILGLPKTQKASYVDGKRRNATKPAKARLFPKPSVLVGKPAASVTEPSSPKVSCMGRVRSKRKTRRSSEPCKNGDNPVERSRSVREEKKAGFCSGFMSMFKSGKSHKKPVQKDFGKVKEEPAVEEGPRMSKSASKRAREISVSFEPVAEPPGLGGMKRFASGRRSTDEFDGVLTGSLDLDRRVGPVGSS